MESMNYNCYSAGARENGASSAFAGYGAGSREIGAPSAFAGYGYGAREIRMGDRVYARVTLYHQTALEITYVNVGSMTDLVGELRYAMRGREGLAKVYIRNHSRGWSCERPMRFYADGSAPRLRRHSRAAVAPSARGSRADGATRTMLFPWETH